MRMLAKKNEDILEAYDAIKIASMSREARMAYEARMAEIMDIRTREFEAKEEGEKLGREKGKYEEKLNIAKNLLDILDNETIALKIGLAIEEIEKLR